VEKNSIRFAFTDDFMEDRSQHRFLMTRLSALGDCLVTLPLACALRDHFPSSRIVWLTQTENAPLLKVHKDIDEVVTVSRRWFRNPSEILRLRSKLQAEQFTTVFDPQSLSKSSGAAWLSNCHERIGLSSPVGREISPILNTVNVSVKEDSHVVDRFLALLRPLGIDNPKVSFRTPVRSESEHKIARFAEEKELLNGYTVTLPYAGWKSRQWSMKRYGQVAANLYGNFGIKTILPWYGDFELKCAEEVASYSDGGAIVAEPLDIFDLTSLMRNARLVIGSDCGPMHLAASVGTPCVSLHGTTRPENSGPYGAQNIWLQMYYHGGSSRTRRTANNAAMLAIQVSHVMEAASKILDKQMFSRDGHSSSARFSNSSRSRQTRK
jgi:heptosyltransferase I